MVKLDLTIFEEVGLGDIPEDDKKTLFTSLVQELELNVGTKLSENLTDEQREEFMQKATAGDQEGARAWLEENAPDYKQVVADELDKLKAKLSEQAEIIKQHIEQGENLSDDV